MVASVRELFATHLLILPGDSHSDIEAKLAAHSQQQSLISDWVCGGDTTGDQVLDCLNDGGIDPYIYLDEVEENLIEAMALGIPLTGLGLVTGHYDFSDPLVLCP